MHQLNISNSIISIRGMQYFDQARIGAKYDVIVMLIRLDATLTVRMMYKLLRHA